MQNMAIAVLEIEAEFPFEDHSQPFIEVAGIEGSRLRVTRQGLTVLPCTSTSNGREPGRFWAFFMHPSSGRYRRSSGSRPSRGRAGQP